MNISLPPEEKAKIEKRAKKAGKSVSAYILYTVKLEEELISEDELLAIARRAEKSYREGKTKILRSLEDLIDPDESSNHTP